MDKGNTLFDSETFEEQIKRQLMIVTGCIRYKLQQNHTEKIEVVSSRSGLAAKTS